MNSAPRRVFDFNEAPVDVNKAGILIFGNFSFINSPLVFSVVKTVKFFEQ